ncbi:MAG: hypothetical protein HY098_03670, partial [Nitrospinae bacterium]|nr:hypothetical protein [Nitrospinota bacterium]
MERKDEGGTEAGKKRKTELDIEAVSAPKAGPPPPKGAPTPPAHAGEEPSGKKPPAGKKRTIVIASLVASLTAVLVFLPAVVSRHLAKRKEAETAAKRREETAKKPGENAAAPAPAPAAPAPPLENPAPTYNFTM